MFTMCGMPKGCCPLNKIPQQRFFCIAFVLESKLQMLDVQVDEKKWFNMLQCARKC